MVMLFGSPIQAKLRKSFDVIFFRFENTHEFSHGHEIFHVGIKNSASVPTSIIDSSEYYKIVSLIKEWAVFRSRIIIGTTGYVQRTVKESTFSQSRA